MASGTNYLAAPFRNHILGGGKRNSFLKRIVLFSEGRGAGQPEREVFLLLEEEALVGYTERGRYEEH